MLPIFSARGVKQGSKILKTEPTGLGNVRCHAEVPEHSERENTLHSFHYMANGLVIC